MSWNLVEETKMGAENAAVEAGKSQNLNLDATIIGTRVDYISYTYCENKASMLRPSIQLQGGGT